MWFDGAQVGEVNGVWFDGAQVVVVELEDHIDINLLM